MDFRLFSIYMVVANINNVKYANLKKLHYIYPNGIKI